MTIYKPWQLFIGVLIASSALFIVASAANAASYTVTKTADTADGSCSAADCSLREAIIAANASTGFDTVTLPAGTYTLTLGASGENAAAQGDLDITGDRVIVNGNSASDTIIDGNSNDRIFELIGEGSDLSLNDVTLQNGSTAAQGGAINMGDSYESQELIVNNCIIKNNTAAYGGGIKAEGGILQITNSTISGNTATSGGGGIYVEYGFLTITNSIIDGNTATAAGGGGISHNGLPLTIQRSTISNNTVDGSDGGGLEITSSHPAIIVNSTVSGNSAARHGGGIIESGGDDLDISHSTITNNTADSDNNSSGDGGGLHVFNAGTTLDLKNSIVSDNIDKGGEGPDCDAVNPTKNILSNGYNIIGDTTGCTDNYTSASTDQLNIDPKLAVAGLADNGGDTKTHALQFSSPAVDAVPTASCVDTDGDAVTQDQREETRPSRSACDIGAYEYQDQAPTITITGDSSMTVKQNATYTDDGATASDTEDGDITSSITTTGSVDTTTLGTYTVTYSVTDSGSNTTTADRTVEVESRGKATKVTPLTNNRVKVKYADGSTQTFTVFNKGTKKPRARLSKNKKYVVVVNKSGKKVKSIRATLGTTVSSKTLRKKKQDQTKMKLFNYYTSNSKNDVIATTRKGNTLRTTHFTLTKNGVLKGKDTKKYTSNYTKNSYKIKKKKKLVKITTKNGMLLVKYRVTKKGNLQNI